MRILLVVNNVRDWEIRVPGVELVQSRKYLTDPAFNEIRYARVFNLCRSYSYQSLGYYVSLLAEARGHKPVPDITTIQNLKSQSLTRIMADDEDDLIQRSLRTVKSEQFALSIYFGRTLAQRDKRLGTRLFNLFPCPMMRAQFVRKKDEWQFQSIRAISAREVPETHMPALQEAAANYFAKRDWSGRTRSTRRYHLAILHDPDAVDAPSDEKSLRKVIRAAHRHDMGAELITKDDFARLGEFDALFIRATTYLNNYTYRFARRAAAEGLAVIDDPVSIARCTNKVYQAERFDMNDVPTPSTVIVHRDNIEQALEELSLPIVLKQPDSSFSRGVVKAESAEEYRARVEELLDESELILAQSFMPTDFDWRVGVLDGEPLYACRYHMAPHHWQIAKHGGASGGKTRFGRVETTAIDEAPKRVISVAVKAAKLIGDGLYGIDLKQSGGKVYVIEVNDNPNLDAGSEDKILKDELYDRLIQWFIKRIHRIREGTGSRD